MAPFAALKDKPAGKLALISHEVTAPPLTVGVLVVMSVSFSSVIFSGEYSRVLGATSMMVMLIWAEVEPPELLAQIV